MVTYTGTYQFFQLQRWTANRRNPIMLRCWPSAAAGMEKLKANNTTPIQRLHTGGAGLKTELSAGYWFFVECWSPHTHASQRSSLDVTDHSQHARIAR